MGALQAAVGAPLGELRCDPCGVDVVVRGDAWSFEHLLASNPGDPNHLVVADMEMSADVHGGLRNTIAVRVSKDGGRTWVDGDFPGDHSLEPGHPFFGARDLVDPFAAILADGTVLVGGLTTTYVWPTIQGTDVFVARSYDGGLTFPDVQIIAEGAGVFPGPARINDHPFIDVGEDGTIIVSWVYLDLMTPLRVPPDQDRANPERNVAPMDFRFSVSRDGGESWTAPATAAMGGYVDHLAPASTAVARDGTLVIAGVKRTEHTSAPDQDPVGWAQWTTGGDGQGNLALVISGDGGETWNTRIVDEIYAMSGMVSAQIARSKGQEYLYVGYNKQTADRIVPMLGVSPDLGKTWNLIELSSDARGLSPSGPSFGVDRHGVAHVVQVKEHGETYEVVVIAASPQGVLGEVTLESLTTNVGPGHYWGATGLDRGAYVMWNSPSSEPGPNSQVFNPAGQDFDLRGARVWLQGGPK